MHILRRLIALVLVITLLFTMTNLSATIVYAITDEEEQQQEEQTNYVAQIGDTKYETFEAAVEEATDKAVIVLLTDYELKSEIKLENDLELTIDLNNHTITAAGNNKIRVYKGNVTIENGKIVRNDEDSAAPLYAYGSNNAQTTGATLTVKNNVTIEAPNCYGLNMMQVSEEGTGKNVSYNGTINFYGKMNSKYGIGMSGNIGKSQSTGYPVLNIKGAEITSSKQGSYFAAKAIYNVENSTISGGSDFGLGIKSGELNLKKSTIICTGEDTTDTTVGYSNGMNPSGAALAIESNTDYANPCNIVIDESTLTSKKGVALYEFKANNATKSVVDSIEVKGGTTFNANFENVTSDSENLKPVILVSDLFNKTAFISNGTNFNSNVMVVGKNVSTGTTKSINESGLLVTNSAVYKTGSNSYVVDSKISVTNEANKQNDDKIYLAVGEGLATISTEDEEATITDLTDKYLTNNSNVISSTVKNNVMTLKAANVGTSKVELNTGATTKSYDVIVYELNPDAYFNNGETIDLSNNVNVSEEIPVTYALGNDTKLQLHENSTSIFEVKTGENLDNNYSEDVTVTINDQLVKTIKVHVINPDIIYIQKGQTVTLEKEYATSSTEGIVEINGKDVTGIAKGTTILSTNNENENSSVTVVVYEVDVTEKVDELNKAEETEASNQGEVVENTGIYETPSDAVKTVVAASLADENGIEFSNDDTKDKIKDAIISSTPITADVIKEEVSDDSNVEISGKAPVDAKNEVKEKYSNSEVATFYDITFVLKANDQEIGNITKLNKKVKITLPMPTITNQLGENMQRKYRVVPFHNGLIGNAMDAKVSNDGSELEFESDGFSLFAITYEDTKSSSSSSSGGGGGGSYTPTPSTTPDPTPTTTPTTTPSTEPSNLTIGSDLTVESGAMVQFVLSSNEDEITDENIKATYPDANVVGDDGKTLGTGNIITVDGVDKTIVIYGDVTGDGTMDIYDVMEMIKHIKKNIELKDAKYIAGNLDKNTEIDIFDVMKLVSVLKGNTNYENII